MSVSVPASCCLSFDLIKAQESNSTITLEILLYPWATFQVNITKNSERYMSLDAMANTGARYISCPLVQNVVSTFIKLAVLLLPDMTFEIQQCRDYTSWWWNMQWFYVQL